jgi:hypothetical protein
MKEKEDIVTQLILSKMKKKKPLINTSESWKRVWNINIYEQCYDHLHHQLLGTDRMLTITSSYNNIMDICKTQAQDSTVAPGPLITN